MRSAKTALRGAVWVAAMVAAEDLEAVEGLVVAMVAEEDLQAAVGLVVVVATEAVEDSEDKDRVVDSMEVLPRPPRTPSPTTQRPEQRDARPFTSAT